MGFYGRTKIARETAAVLEALDHAGISAWVVGGCVRDMLRGVTPHDWDVAAAATPDEIRSALSRFRLIETGIQHGTLTAVSGGVPVEVTACRGEGAYRDMRHPESVSFNRSIEADLARRDFTINALAYAPSTGFIDLFRRRTGPDGRHYPLHSPPGGPLPGGRAAYPARVAVCVGAGLQIERETSDAIHALAGNLRKISVERCASGCVSCCWVKMPRRSWVNMRTWRRSSCRWLCPCRDFITAREHGGDLWHHSITPLPYAPENLPVRLALVLRDCAKPVTQLRGEDYPGHAERGAEMVEEALRGKAARGAHSADVDVGALSFGAAGRGPERDSARAAPARGKRRF